MFRPAALAIAAVLVGATASLNAQTNGYLVPCSAPAPLGRGCTTLTDPTDPASILSNPAGLATIGGRTLSLGGAAFLPTMSYQNGINATTAGKNNVFPLPAVFYADHIRGRVTLGAGALTLGGMGTDYRLTHALLGPDQRYHSKFGLMKGGLVAAVQVSPRFTLGATAGALYGQIEFATPYAVNPAQLAGLAGLAQDPDYAPLLAGFTEAVAYAEMKGLTGFGFTAGASAQYQLTPGTTVALAWTAPSTVTLDGGTAAMDMNAQFGQLYQGMVAAKGGDTAAVNAQLAGFGINLANGMATRFASAVDIGVPQTVTLALGARASERVRFGADVGWIGWKRAFRTMPVRLAGGTNANVNIMMNGNPANGTFSAAWPLAWNDAWTARAGVEFAATPELRLHGGAIYGTNPVPNDGLFTVFPAITQGAATLGAAYERGNMHFNLAYAHAFRSAQTASAPHLVATEYAGSTSRLTEDTFSFGVEWRF